MKKMKVFMVMMVAVVSSQSFAQGQIESDCRQVGLDSKGELSESVMADYSRSLSSAQLSEMATICKAQGKLLGSLGDENGNATLNLEAARLYLKANHFLLEISR